MKAGFMKVQIKGQRFESIMEMQAVSQAMLEIIITWKFSSRGETLGPVYKLRMGLL